MQMVSRTKRARFIWITVDDADDRTHIRFWAIMDWVGCCVRWRNDRSEGAWAIMHWVGCWVREKPGGLAEPSIRGAS